MRPEVQFWDKMLPDQPEHAHLYKGSAFMRDLFEVVCRSSGIRNPHDEFKLEQSDLFTPRRWLRIRSPCGSCSS